MVVLSVFVVTYFGTFCYYMFGSCRLYSTLNFYYLHSFFYDVIKIKAAGLIYIPVWDKVWEGRRHYKNLEGMRD